MPIGMDNKAERRKFFGALVIPLLLVVVMWVIKIIELSFGTDLSPWGLIPQTAKGLWGILTITGKENLIYKVK